MSGSSRLACNPPNAILNYLYAVLESEVRLAVVALGLDPGIGVLHVDTDARDSLALDVMEAVRPHVDAYVWDWMAHQPFRREWFFEQRDGSCRLMGSFARQLSETAPAWARAVAPVAERVAEVLWSTIRRPEGQPHPATRLTQRRRREAKSQIVALPQPPARPPRVCRSCGVGLRHGTYCPRCATVASTENLHRVESQAWIATQRPEAQARRAATQRQQARALRAGNPSDQPAWLTEQIYTEKVQPRLANLPTSTLATALDVSWPYAKHIRTGKRRPHPRHWLLMANLVDVAKNS